MGKILKELHEKKATEYHCNKVHNLQPIVAILQENNATLKHRFYYSITEKIRKVDNMDSSMGIYF